MTTDSVTPSSPEPTPDSPGRLRTWWHPLLASSLRWLCGNAYSIQEEVAVGKKPLQIDILLIEQDRGTLTDDARRMLAGLVEYLNEHTLIEFKGPTSTLRRGDFRTFLAYAHLYCVQNEPEVEPSRLNLLTVAPRLTEAYQEELQSCGVRPVQVSAGIWSLEGPLLYRMWLLETSLLGDAAHPLLALFSPSLLSNPWQLFEALIQSGCQELASFVFQQVQQFQDRGEEFVMQHGRTDELNQVLHSLVERNLGTLTPEERVKGLSPEERIKGLPPEERVKGLPPEERVKGLPPEERVKGLPPEERVKGLSPEERVKGLPPEERVKGLPPEERVKGLPPEERVKGLSPEERVKGLPPEERIKGLSPEELLAALPAEERKRFLAHLKDRILEEGPSLP